MSKPGTIVFKLTDEDWYPSYVISVYSGIPYHKLVKVALYELNVTTWRVCVWGADDFGMERDYSGEYAEAHARMMFNTVITLDKVRVRDLDANGFQRA